MNKNKLIIEWLKQLPEPFKSQAIKNHTQRPYSNSPLTSGKLSNAVIWAFVWEGTPEGHKYWENFIDILRKKEKATKKKIQYFIY